jgi:hypothetical protein
VEQSSYLGEQDGDGGAGALQGLDPLEPGKDGARFLMPPR